MAEKPTENANRAVAPDAAEIAAITKLLDGVQTGKRQYEQGLIKDQDVLLIAVMAINTLDPLVRKLLAAVEALESENARLRGKLKTRHIIEDNELTPGNPVDNDLARVEALEAENARLRADLNELTDDGLDYDIREGIYIDDD